MYGYAGTTEWCCEVGVLGPEGGGESDSVELRSSTGGSGPGEGARVELAAWSYEEARRGCSRIGRCAAGWADGVGDDSAAFTNRCNAGLISAVPGDANKSATG